MDSCTTNFFTMPTFIKNSSLILKEEKVLHQSFYSNDHVSSSVKNVDPTTVNHTLKAATLEAAILEPTPSKVTTLKLPAITTIDMLKDLQL